MRFPGKISGVGVLAVTFIATGLAVSGPAARATGSHAADPQVAIATWVAGEGTTYASPTAIVQDSTGDGNDGLTNDTTWVAGDPTDNADAGGSALSFSGSADSYVDVPTADDLALSRTIALSFDVNFAVSPATQTQSVLVKSAGDTTQTAWAVEMSPAVTSGCPSCATVGLFWGGQWVTSAPNVWATGTWYTITVTDDGTTVTFSSGASPADQASIGSSADPTGGEGTTSSDGSLFIGGGPGSAPLAGSLQDVRLTVPLTVAPAVGAPSLSYSSAAVGTPITVTAPISGAWGNPDDPYLPQPNINEELAGDSSPGMVNVDPGSITATAVINAPDGTAVDVPGFLDQNFVDDDSAIEPSGAPTWTFRYTPRNPGQYSVAVMVTTFDGTTATTASGPAGHFTVASNPAPGYQGFAEVDTTPGDNGRYYQYTGTGHSFFTTGSNLEIAEFSDASHVYAQPGLLGGSAGKVEDINGTETPGVGETAGNGLTATTLGYVYQEYTSDIGNLVSAHANGARLRLDSLYLPLELCPAGDWTTNCSPDLVETYTARGPSKQHGLVGYPDGVLPSASAIFADPSDPQYFGTFAVGSYSDANAWIVDQVVEQARQGGLVLQLAAWNTNVDYGSSCYVLADVMPLCSGYDHGQDNQALAERRLYYDDARWGYSPSVLSWEFINEYPGNHLSPFWAGKTVSTAGGGSQYVPGVTAWWQTFNDTTSSDTNPHIVTSSCSSTLPQPLCDPVDQAESHWYAFHGVAKAYDQITWICVPGEPCLRSEYGISDNTPSDPNNWVTHKGAWAAIAANYSGAWLWWTEQQLDNPSNTPANPGVTDEHDYVASYDPWTGQQSDNPYSSYTGIATFASSWPAYGPGDPHGLDSYDWQQADVTGSKVTGGEPGAAFGLAGESMIGTDQKGALNAIVWVVNNQSTGGNPATSGYKVVPASTITVSPCLGCAGFAQGAKYTVEMYDTVTGTALGQFTTTVTGSSGTVKIKIPAIATDLAITIASVTAG